MRQQWRELPTDRHNKKRRPTGKLKLHKAPESPATNQVNKPYDNRQTHRMPDCCNKCGDSNMATFPVYATKKTQVHHRNSCRNLKAHQLHASPMYVQDGSKHSHSEESSSDESFCLQLQVQMYTEGKQIPHPVHIIMNLAYCFKWHHTRNIYLQAWLDTCADVNIMPASVYWLVLKDPKMRKIKPCKRQISTYTGDTVKIIGSCMFGIVHPDTKKLVPVTFHVVNNDGSILLSCKITLALCLTQPQSRLDYLPPWASLITSTMDYPKKT